MDHYYTAPSKECGGIVEYGEQFGRELQHSLGLSAYYICTT